MSTDTIQAYAIAFVIFVILGIIVSFIASQINKETRGHRYNLLTGFSTEMLAATLTTVAMGLIFQTIQDNELRKEFILEMGSPNNVFAVEGARKLSAKGWLQDGSLKEQSFIEADLSNADLLYADFQYAKLNNAILVKTDLTGAQFQNASLIGADLTGATLKETDFTGAWLTSAILKEIELKEVTLTGAHMQKIELETDSNIFVGTDLTGVDLGGVNLYNVRMYDVVICNTNFSGSNLVGTGLTDEMLKYAIVDEDTILDNGISWSSDVFEMETCPSK